MSQLPIPAETPVSAVLPLDSIPRPTSARLFGLDSLDGLLVLTMTLWAGNIVISKAATTLIAPLPYNGVRFAVAVFALFIALRVRHIPLRLPRTLWLPVLWTGLTTFTLYQLTFITGLHMTTAGNNALIIAIGPLWVVLINALRGHERISRTVLIGTVLALIGVGAVVFGRSPGAIGFDGTTLAGDGLSLAASLFWGIGVLATRSAVTKDPTIPHSTITFWALFIGALTQIVLGAGAIHALPLSVFTPDVVLVLIYSGGLSVALGTLIFNFGVEKRGAARTAIFSYLQPLIAAGLAIVFLGESLSVWLIVGIALIFGGMALVRRT